MRPDQNDETQKVKRQKLWICQSAVDTRQEGFFMRSIIGYVY